MKQMVKEINAFDFNTGVKHLKATYHADIESANAILRLHAADLFSPSAEKKAVEWLSLATVAQKEQFRRVFGVIQTPSPFCAIRADDYNIDAKFLKGEKTIREPRTMVGMEHIHPRSAVHTFPQNSQAETRTSYGQNYSWKFGRVPLAFSQRAEERRERQLEDEKKQMEIIAAVQKHVQSGVTTAVVLPAHLLPEDKEPKATQHSLMPSPWGLLDTGNIDKTQWESVTHDTFKNTIYLSDKNQRAHQNFNDNYCRMAYLQHRQEKQRLRESLRASRLSSNATGEVVPSTSSLSQQSVVAGGARSHTAPLPQYAKTISWLEKKATVPVSVVFPSI